MCIIALDTRPKGQRLDIDVFKRAQERNPDGMGIMWVSDGELHMYRSLDDFEGIWNRYCNARHQGHITAVHFRKNTKGNNSVENCHPFDLGGMALMHNGTIHAAERLIPQNSDESDTAFVARHVIRHLPTDFLNRPLLRYMFTSLLGGDRALFMDSHGRYTILNESTGAWRFGNAKDGGVWFSHQRYLYWLLNGTEVNRGYSVNDHRSSTNGKPKRTRSKTYYNKESLSKEDRLIFAYGRMLDHVDIESSAHLPMGKVDYAGTAVAVGYELWAMRDAAGLILPGMFETGDTADEVHGILLATAYNSLGIDIVDKEFFDGGFEAVYDRHQIKVYDNDDKCYKAWVYLPIPAMAGRRWSIAMDGDWGEWVDIYDEYKSYFDNEPVKLDSDQFLLGSGDDELACPKCNSRDVVPFDIYPDDKAGYTDPTPMLWCADCVDEHQIGNFENERRMH